MIELRCYSGHDLAESVEGDRLKLISEDNIQQSLDLGVCQLTVDYIPLQNSVLHVLFIGNRYMLENHSNVFGTNLLITIKVIPEDYVTIYTKYLHFEHQSELRVKTAAENLHAAVNETLLAYGAIIVAHEAVEPLSHDARKTQVLQLCCLGNFRVGAQLFIQLVEVIARLL